MSSPMYQIEDTKGTFKDVNILTTPWQKKKGTKRQAVKNTTST